MKKILCLFLAFMFVFLCSCASGEESKAESFDEVSEGALSSEAGSEAWNDDNSKDFSGDNSEDVSDTAIADLHKGEYIDLMASIKADKIDSCDLSIGNGAYSAFAAKLFGESLSKDGENTLVSPLSVIYALGLTANGTDGNTKKQFENLFGISIEELNNYLYSYGLEKSKKDASKFSIANSIWYDKDRITVHKSFLQKNADYFGATAYQVDFNNKKTVDLINGWVSENTDGMIKEIIDSIEKDSVMFLINALSFEAEWTSPYDKNSVRNGEFTLENGEKVTVEYMYSDGESYIADENTEGFIKNYKGGYAFVALLPDEEIEMEEYISTLTGEKITKLLDSKKEYSETNVLATLPKFETEFEISMVETLKSMGVTDAFAPGAANFSNMGEADGLHIGDVVHKTFISVGEKGTRAGAVTLVDMKEECEPVISKEVYLNRPFAYMLIDTQTNTPFFIGTMMNPA